MLHRIITASVTIFLALTVVLTGQGPSLAATGGTSDKTGDVSLRGGKDSASIRNGHDIKRATYSSDGRTLTVKWYVVDLQRKSQLTSPALRVRGNLGEAEFKGSVSRSVRTGATSVTLLVNRGSGWTRCAASGGVDWATDTARLSVAVSCLPRGRTISALRVSAETRRDGYTVLDYSPFTSLRVR